MEFKIADIDRDRTYTKKELLDLGMDYSVSSALLKGGYLEGSKEAVTGESVAKVFQVMDSTISTREAIAMLQSTEELRDLNLTESQLTHFLRGCGMAFEKYPNIGYRFREEDVRKGILREAVRVYKKRIERKLEDERRKSMEYIREVRKEFVSERDKVKRRELTFFEGTDPLEIQPSALGIDDLEEAVRYMEIRKNYLEHMIGKRKGK